MERYEYYRDEAESDSDDGRSLFLIINILYSLLLLVFIPFYAFLSKYELRDVRDKVSIKEYAVRIHAIEDGYQGNIVNNIKEHMAERYGQQW
jgi:hypothetical protein